MDITQEKSSCHDYVKKIKRWVKGLSKNSLSLQSPHLDAAHTKHKTFEKDQQFDAWRPYPEGTMELLRPWVTQISQNPA